MFVSASSVETAVATVLTRSVGSVARIIDPRYFPEHKPELARREGFLLAVTGVFTVMVLEVFQQCVLPLFKPNSMVAAHHRIARTILALPGLVLIECLSRLLMKELGQKQAASHAMSCVRQNQGFVHFMQSCEKKAAASRADARMFIA